MFEIVLCHQKCKGYDNSTIYFLEFEVAVSKKTIQRKMGTVYDIAIQVGDDNIQRGLCTDVQNLIDSSFLFLFFLVCEDISISWIGRDHRQPGTEG